jgi:hypothetical protein
VLVTVLSRVLVHLATALMTLTMRWSTKSNF